MYQTLDPEERRARRHRGRHGDLERIERFEKYYVPEPNSGCWLWFGGAVPKGYGSFYAGPKVKMISAYRWSYEHHVGLVPQELELDHLCRTPACVNPRHLEPVPRQINVLRGISPIAENAKKTHCVNGHEFDDANTYIRPRTNGRSCRTCVKNRSVAYKRKASKMSLPSVETVLFNHLIKEREQEERAPSLLADKLHANASSAGGCARAIGLRVLGVKDSNPLTGDSLFNFYLGDAIHDKVQDAILATYPNAEKEVNGVVEDFITVRADLRYLAEDNSTVVGEIKSMADFGFEKATGTKLKSNGRWGSNSAKAKQNKPIPAPEGPKPEHLLQTLISAIALDAKYIAIIYVRKTAAKDEQILAEWRFPVNDLKDAANLEIERLRHIVELAKQGLVPSREYQGAFLENVDKIKYPCGYCGHLATCMRLGAGVVPLTKTATK